MKVYEICFSPTGGTRKVADLITGLLPGDRVPVDLTVRPAMLPDTTLTGEDLAVLAVPSYGGRVPAPAAERIAALSGNGARAVLVCVYGNRAYEDTLVELQDLARQAGFRPEAGLAAVAEHSIARQFAAGRPDEEDRRQLESFGRQIAAKLAAGTDAEPALPGNRPYRKAGGAGLVPRPTAACNGCGTCARECPVEAIHPRNPKRVNTTACLSCMRCVSVCPRQARKVNSVLLAAVGLALRKVCTARRENQLFL